MVAATPSATLPELRPDLTLLQGAAAEDGAPTWLIHDVSRNRYFQLSLDAFRALSRWQSGISLAEFQQRCDSAGLDLDDQDLAELLRFLSFNQLTLASGASQIRALLQQYQRSKEHWLTWLLHHYLFIRIPIWRPDRFLDRSWPWVSRLISPGLLLTIRLLGVVGLLMVAQQWDAFSSTFLHFLSMEGLALYGITLIVVKSAHELGHAYVAKRYGCKVGSIGVAFMVLLPVLYTDTTDAWRLRSHRERLRIAAAGVATEFHLAMLATFAWSFLPDGPARSAAFFVATTSWITSLLVNLSPFMRFDGYFVLSDLLHAQNLQPRAFGLARWHLRETLFGLGEPPPEYLPAWRQRLFIGYAYATWVYRFILFIGIAILVYQFAFKLLGILLFAVEIGWFILRPLNGELGQWWKRRQAMRLNARTLTTCAGLLLVIAAFTVPWRATVTVPAVLTAGEFRPVYSMEQGRITELSLTPLAQVAAGSTLLKLEQPELDHALAQSQRELALVEELSLIHI